MGFFDVIGSAVKGIFGGPKSALNDVLADNGGDVAKAAESVISAGETTKTIVTTAGGIALGAGLAGGLTGSGGGGTINLPKLNLKDLNLKTLTSNLKNVTGVIDSVKAINPSALTKVFGSPSQIGIGGNEGLSPSVDGGSVSIPIGNGEVQVGPGGVTIKDAKEPTVAPTSEKKIPLWAWVVGGLILLAAMGVSFAKKITRAVGLKF